MDIRASARYIHMSPRKIRLVVDVVRGMDASSAVQQLRFLNKAAARPVLKLLESAMANAQNNFSIDPTTLFVKKVCADQGPVFKRWQPRAMGRATPIRKPTTHISVVLAPREASTSSTVPAASPKKKLKKKTVRKTLSPS